MENTMTVTPSEGSDTRRAALIFYATGRTAAGLRAKTANPGTAAAIAASASKTEAEIGAEMVDLADGIDQIAAEGLTLADCWKLLGWSPDFVKALLTSDDGAR
jgi:hypothetical protein